MAHEYLLSYIKSGATITNASGVANVVFVNQIPYGITYTVLLSLVDEGNTVSAIGSASNLTQTGFTINTRETKLTGGTYNQAPNIHVYWFAIPEFNE
jgi:hypothetical protein